MNDGESRHTTTNAVKCNHNCNHPEKFSTATARGAPLLPPAFGGPPAGAPFTELPPIRVPPSSEVFSTDWSFGAGQDECCFGDGADPLRAQSDAVERLPAGFEQRDPAFAFGA